MEKPKGRNIWNILDKFKGDKVILMVALLLMLISVISVFSSTPLLALEKGIDRISIMTSQLKVVGIGVFVIAFLYVFGSSKWYRPLAMLCFWGSMALLVILVFNLKLGFVQAGEINGARRIIKVFGGQLHVYEFVKVMMVFYLAWALDTYKKDGFTWTKRQAARFPRLRWLASPSGEKLFYIYTPILLVTGCVMMGSNSSALFIGGIMILLILVGGIDYKDIAAVAGLLVILALLFFFGYKAGIIPETGRIATAVSRIFNDDQEAMETLVTARAGSREYNEARDQLKQPVGALLAIKEGGIIGKGIGGSTQKYTVPVIFGDYMFSFIIEETGIIGAIVIILLFFSLLARGTLVAKDCDDYFDKIVVVGLTILVTGQAFMHMAVNVHMPLVPQTGQTLPLVSHGTNSFLVFSAVFGILLSISRETWKKMKRREAEATPLIGRHDEVQDSLTDLEMLENGNITEEENKYGEL